MKTIISVIYFNIGVDTLGFIKHFVHEYSVRTIDKKQSSGNMYKPKHKTFNTFTVKQFYL